MNQYDIPAFPTREKIGEEVCQVTGTLQDVFGNFGGMTLRDYFAAAALTAAVQKAMHNFGVDGITATAKIDWDHIAGSAFDAADAMLQAREEQ